MEEKYIYEHWLFQGINKIVYLIYASLLWCVFSLPIITMGAATSALYYVVHKVIQKEEGHVFYEFWKSFRMNFKQTAVIGIVLMLINVIAVVNSIALYAFYSAGEVGGILVGIYLIFFALILMVESYFFPYIARFENSTKVIVKNSIYLALANLLQSLRNLVFMAAAGVIIVFFPFMIVIVPAVYMRLIYTGLEKVFQKYMTAEEVLEEEE